MVRFKKATVLYCSGYLAAIVREIIQNRPLEDTIYVQHTCVCSYLYTSISASMCVGKMAFNLRLSFMYLLAAPVHFQPLAGARAAQLFQALSAFKHPLAHTQVWDGIPQFLPYLHIIDVHPRPLLPHEDVVDVHQNVPLQGERQLLS